MLSQRLLGRPGARLGGRWLLSRVAKTGGTDHVLPTLARGCSASGDNHSAVRAFLRELGYSDDVSDGVLKTLTSPEGFALPASEIHGFVTKLAGAWEVGEDAGLKPLAKAVERELAVTAGKATVRFVVEAARGGQSFACEGFEGMSVKDVSEHGDGAGAQLLGEALECACSGVMACSTCHVYVDDVWWDAVGPPSEAEQDMLDLAHEPRDTSRLACQLVLSPAVDGMRLTIPAGANNLFDYIPFE